MGKQESQSWQKTTRIPSIRLQTASHHSPALPPQRKIAHRRGGGPLHQAHELGLLLRREGLYSSHLSSWRLWRLRVHPTLATKNKTPTDSQICHEKVRLERENARLRLKLEHAEKLLALPKRCPTFWKRSIATRGNQMEGSRHEARRTTSYDVATAPACNALDVSRATWYRRRAKNAKAVSTDGTSPVALARRFHPRRISCGDRKHILEILCCDRLLDMTPRGTHAALLSQGI